MSDFRRAGAQHLVARRAARRRRRRLVALTAGVTSLVLGGFAAVWAQFDPDAGVAADRADVAGASTSREVSRTSTTTIATPTTAEPNDLLAPPPTVVPDVDIADGLAPLIHRVDTTDRVIFITIDDGMVRDPAYLDRFDDLGVPFTSFLTVPFAEADPGYWRSTQELGGTVQAHTINHPDLRRVGEATVRREVCEPAETFTELFGTRPTLFRPPYGNSNDTVRRVAAECGYRAVIHWTGSTNIGQLTMQDVELTPGDIILMHYRDTLLADLDDVMARARAEGFRIGRLEDYLAPD